MSDIDKRVDELERKRSKETVVYRMLNPGAVVPDAKPGRRVIRLVWGDDNE